MIEVFDQGSTYIFKGWGCIQEWGFIQANAVDLFTKKIQNRKYAVTMEKQQWFANFVHFPFHNLATLYFRKKLEKSVYASPSEKLV